MGEPMRRVVDSRAWLVWAVVAIVVIGLIGFWFRPTGIRFVEGVDNPYFPLPHGSVMVYEGEGGKVVETITVLADKKMIGDIEATVVKDVTREGGELAEETFDWYAQDSEGNVWYLGENTVEYEDGVADPAGSWQHGEDGGRGGIIMRADPTVLDSDWQERYAGEAESMSLTVATDSEISVPAGDFTDTVHTLEWSPLEPKQVGEKYYVRGIGLVYERAMTGGELLKLVEVR